MGVQKPGFFENTSLWRADVVKNPVSLKTYARVERLDPRLLEEVGDLGVLFFRCYCCF